MNSRSQASLFEAHSEDNHLEIPVPGSETFSCPEPIRYLTAALPEERSDNLFDSLLHSLDWQQPAIRIAGKRIPIPRLQCWQGDRPHAYSYSGERFVAQIWHPDVLAIKNHIETISGQQFNSVLCNLYRDGQDSVSWHADDEPELGASPWIASYSLGATREFQIKLKKNYQQTVLESSPLPGNSKQTLKLALEHNSLLIMPPELQKYCHHQLPKTRRALGPRINLTFRRIVS